MTVLFLESAPYAPRSWVPLLEIAETQARRLCGRKAVFGADVDDFVSWSRLRIMDNDYAILRKFRGDCSIESFLAAVTANLFRDFQNHRFGKWRASAAAKRAGDLAVALEAAVYRDDMGLRSAVAFLESRGYPTLSVTRAAEILEELPQRDRRMFVGDGALRTLASDERADRRVMEAEQADALERATHGLELALGELDAEDRIIVELRFREGLSVADIARSLGIAQKPLYRRLPRILAQLRSSEALRGVEIGRLVE